MGQTEQEVATIAVMGATGSGKTTFINLVSGSQLRTSEGLKSCTEVVAATDPFPVDGRKVVLVDTPGFDDTTRSDSEILKLIADFLATSYQNGYKLTGLLFIHRISDFRMGGISLKNFKTFRKLCGEATLRNVIIVTNMWGEVTPELGAQREHELSTSPDFFLPALDKGAKMMRHLNTSQSGITIVKHILGSNNPMALQIQTEIVEERKDVSQTAAAEEIERELRAEKERQRVEAERVKREMEEAAKRRDEQLRWERDQEALRRQAELDRIAAEQKRVQEQMERERLEMERRMREEEEARRREMERIHRENQARIEQERIAAEEAQRRAHEEQARLQRELEWQMAQRRRRRRHGDCFIMPPDMRYSIDYAHKPRWGVRLTELGDGELQEAVYSEGLGGWASILSYLYSSRSEISASAPRSDLGGARQVPLELQHDSNTSPTTATPSTAQYTTSALLGQATISITQAHTLPTAVNSTLLLLLLRLGLWRVPHHPPRRTLHIRKLTPEERDFRGKIQLGGEQERGVREAGRLAKRVREYAGSLVKVGVTTDEIDRAVHEYIVKHGAYPSPLGYQEFPKACCTSVNNVVVHGIPDGHPLEDGDIINIDITLYLNGYHGDTSQTFPVGTVVRLPPLPPPSFLIPFHSPLPSLSFSHTISLPSLYPRPYLSTPLHQDAQGQSLISITNRALQAAISACGPGKPFKGIAQAIHTVLKGTEYCVSGQFTGHGIGPVFHSQPWIVHSLNEEPGVMQPGHCFTIEPAIIQGSDPKCWIFPDGWTASTEVSAFFLSFVDQSGS
ncbi:hypothetical protein NMY22_g16205 [Coprinellus aureogranulatus]|nr:hypothetical protein NMY22_g16205 [Coprinellus aureogranulatus]